ncbi:hypothetical protein ABIF65_001671 [Bradyrhizobium japonicum]|nr:hypothetical protein [Bradyrhizobium japonicum]MCP1778397.1 hypothetical protein [Bradyrhizobium japonicum]MCP1857840.1 hypothetical protein [Bradyrhizobium japonicum]MCP1888654.1 hypothetical protein [Bradyrhizobium japonicum]MCP1958605.1 hypothetical protein [Bradyrhizobium japonicum]
MGLTQLQSDNLLPESHFIRNPSFSITAANVVRARNLGTHHGARNTGSHRRGSEVFAE